MQLLIPGGGASATDLDVDFNTFRNILTEAIDQKYVQSFSEEVPPGVISGVPLD
jgi:hypothetical protein